jgi:hypothetical protein
LGRSGEIRDVTSLRNEGILGVVLEMAGFMKTTEDNELSVVIFGCDLLMFRVSLLK